MSPGARREAAIRWAEELTLRGLRWGEEYSVGAVHIWRARGEWSVDVAGDVQRFTNPERAVRRFMAEAEKRMFSVHLGKNGYPDEQIRRLSYLCA